MNDLMSQVVPVERQIYCQRCGFGVTPKLSERGPHIRADCSQCGRYLKFVKQIKDHPEELEPELYEEQLPW